MPILLAIAACTGFVADMAEESYKVTLNVYDLSQGLARQMSVTLLGKAIEGIWHTGVSVYGNEYYYGGGIQVDRAGSTPYGTPLRVIDLGVTHVPKDVFEIYLQEIGPQYTAERYSLLAHNCNNFSNEVSQFLVGVSIPEYILNLPNEVMSSPMGSLMLPIIQQLEATLRSGGVPKAPQFVSSGSAQSMLASKNIKSTVSDKTPTQLASNGFQLENQIRATTDRSDQNDSVNSPRNARNKLHEEIRSEFEAIMATGTLRASEAAALATKRVMQRHGPLNNGQS